MTFFDIFSKDKEEKSKKESKIKIIADNREKNSLVISQLIKNNANVELKQLEIADYLIGETAIERKTFSDLQSSIINKRIFDQLKNLKQYKSRLLILEGNSDLFIHENAIRGFILSCSLDYETPTIFTKDETDTASYLSVLAKRTKNKEVSLRQSISFKSKEEQQQYILEGFPGIGPVTAKALLKQFKSLKNIISAPKEELKEILGKKADDFLKLIN
jgi:Fanconi anemia group M protein